MNECALEEKCSLCSNQATHKIEEVLPDDEFRHPFSNYLCCSCFGIVLGNGAKSYCKNNHDFDLKNTFIQDAIEELKSRNYQRINDPRIK